MKKLSKKIMLSLFLGLSMVTSVALASSSSGDSKTIQMSKDARQIMAHPDGTKATKGIVSLQDYIVEEKERYDWIFKNHPIFKTYLPKGKVVGKLRVTDRGYEFAHSGNGNEFQKYSKRKGLTSTMYRLPTQDPLVFQISSLVRINVESVMLFNTKNGVVQDTHPQLDSQVSIQKLVMS